MAAIEISKKTKRRHLSAKQCSIPGTEWISFGDKDADGKQISVLIDKRDGHPLTPEEITERIRMLNSDAEIDMIRVQYIAIMNEIHSQKEKAKKAAREHMDKALEELKEMELPDDEHAKAVLVLEAETDSLFVELWGMKVQPRIEEGKVIREKLIEIIDGKDGPEVLEAIKLLNQKIE